MIAMFEIKYKIVKSKTDDFRGQNGFFQVICNEECYGDYFEDTDKFSFWAVDLYDCFLKYLKVAIILIDHTYAAISDTESYNAYIEITRCNDLLNISLVYADKLMGTTDICKSKLSINETVWTVEGISQNKFCEEILNKSKEYFNEIADDSKKLEFGEWIRKLENKF